MVVTVKVPAVPMENAVLFALEIEGVSSAVRVNDWVPFPPVFVAVNVIA